VAPLQYRVRWRTPTLADLPQCLDVQRTQLGDELVGEDRARRVWTQLIGLPACISAVFESAPPKGPPRIIGFGASVFVSSAFAAAELGQPRPGINARIVASIHEGRSVVLGREEIARSNAGAGLDVVMMYGSWLAKGLSDQEDVEVQQLLPLSLVQLISGYKIRSMFGQATGNQIPFMRKSGIVREIGTYPELDQVFNVMTSAEAFARPTSIAGPMFVHQEPVLGLSEAEQRLLAAALEGHTDAELAASLGLGLPAIKARWRSIFARFSDLRLGVEETERDGRGIQKRHRVLAYIRQHPEELRPFSAG
jgi:DNA-binding CsgD family transcriptional regulator